MDGRGYSCMAGAICALLLGSAQGALAASGDLDTSFSHNGIALLAPVPAGGSSAAAIAALPDDSVIVATAGLDRLTPQGERDEDFASRSKAALNVLGESPFVGDLAPYPGGGVLAVVSAGPKDARRFQVVRFQRDGSVDLSFGPSRDGTISAVAVDAAGRVVFGAGQVLSRYLPDGSPDPAFGSEGSVDTGRPISDVAVRPDGSIVLLADGLVQYGADGALDSSFEPSRTLYELAGLALAPDGAAYMRSTGYGLYPGCEGYVVKVAPSGDVSNLSAGSGCPYRNSLVVDPEGRLTTAAFGGSYEPPAYLSVDRTLPSGEDDETFGDGGLARSYPGGCEARPRALTLDARGRTLVSVTACSRIGVVRLSTGPGERDGDGDGLRDRSDECPVFPSVRHRGCPEVGRRIKVQRLEGTRKRGRLRGTILVRGREPTDEALRIPPPYDSGSVCESYWRVQLLETRPGPDRVIGRTRANRFGGWGFTQVRLRPHLAVRIRGGLTGIGFCGRAAAAVPLDIPMVPPDGPPPPHLRR